MLETKLGIIQIKHYREPRTGITTNLKLSVKQNFTQEYSESGKIRVTISNVILMCCFFVCVCGSFLQHHSTPIDGDLLVRLTL